MIPREAALERRDGDVFKYLNAELQQSYKIQYLITVCGVKERGVAILYCTGLSVQGLMFCLVANSCEGIWR